MYFITWTGVGLLVPVIALACFFISSLCGGFLPAAGVDFIGAATTTIALLAGGLALRSRNIARNLYFIPMEYWAIASCILAISEIPKLFGAA